MKKTLLLIIILNLGFVSFGQEWTWPVKITEPDKSGEWTDMIVDTNGIVHIVYWDNDLDRVVTRRMHTRNIGLFGFFSNSQTKK